MHRVRLRVDVHHVYLLIETGAVGLLSCLGIGQPRLEYPPAKNYQAPSKHHEPEGEQESRCLSTILTIDSGVD